MRVPALPGVGADRGHRPHGRRRPRRAHGGPEPRAACRHDHRVKHEGGWHLAQPEAGTFVWTSPTGHSYERLPRPVIPDVPDPAPGRYRSSTAPEGLASDEPIWTDDPYPDDACTDRPPSAGPPPGRPPPRTGRLPDEPPF